MSKSILLATDTAQVFRDKAFKSRTLILKDGRAVPVENYTVTTSDKDVIAYLDGHADFARQPAAADSAAE